MIHRFFMVMLLGAVAIAPGADSKPVAIERLAPPHEGFFAKRLVCMGVPIYAHADVSDAALTTAADRVTMMLGKLPVIAANLHAAGAELQLVGKDQNVTDLPLYRHMAGVKFEGEKTMDQRGRGYGGIITTFSEENLLKLDSDRFKDHRDICVHEFAHTVHEFGLSPNVMTAITQRYTALMKTDLWPGCYTRKNDREFFAETTMWYFGTRGDYGKLHDPAPGREWLKKYDPETHALLEAVWTGKLTATPVEWVTLEDHGAASEKQLRSVDSKKAAAVLLANDTDRPLRAVWLDFKGNRVPYDLVQPHCRRSESTYVGHPWLLVDDNEGKAVAVFVPTSAHCRAAVK